MLGEMAGAPWVIYGLRAPGTEEVRYVGKTENPSPHRRLGVHVSQARAGRGNPHLVNWIRQILRNGGKPVQIILERGEGSGWIEAEKRWIAAYKDSTRLVNATEGGEGLSGRQHTQETRNKIAAAVARAYQEPDTQARHRDACRAAQARPAARAAHGVASRLAWARKERTPPPAASPEEAAEKARKKILANAKRSACMKARWGCPEQREKLRAAL